MWHARLPPAKLLGEAPCGDQRPNTLEQQEPQLVLYKAMTARMADPTRLSAR
jgi:hypothetical protein